MLRSKTPSSQLESRKLTGKMIFNVSSPDSCSKVKKIRIKGYASKTFVPEMKAVSLGNEEKVARIDRKTCTVNKLNAYHEGLEGHELYSSPFQFCLADFAVGVIGHFEEFMPEFSIPQFLRT